MDFHDLRGKIAPKKYFGGQTWKIIFLGHWKLPKDVPNQIEWTAGQSAWSKNSAQKCWISDFQYFPLIFPKPTLRSRWTLILPKPLWKVSDPPKFSKIRPTSNSCNFLTTEPISKFLVPRMFSSSWNARKQHLQPDILSSTHPSGSKREENFRKIPVFLISHAWRFLL